MAKFHEQAIIIFGAEQTGGEGVSASIAGTDAMAALDLDYSDNLSTETYRFVGDENDRDALTVLTDRYGEFNFKTLIPKLPNLGGSAATEADLPMARWLKACGGSVTALPGTGTSAGISITNSVAENALLTTQIRLTSADDPDYQKLYEIEDCRGTADLMIEIGKKGEISFEFKGNTNVPTRVAKLVADFEDQKQLVGSNATMYTVIQSEIQPDTGAFSGIKNFCFGKLDAKNVFGFEYDRFKTGCNDGFSKGAIPSEVTVTVLDDTVGAGIFTPEEHIQEYFQLKFVVGDETDGYYSVEFSRLQLVGYSNSKLGKYRAKDWKFSNVGFTTIQVLAGTGSLNVVNTKPKYGIAAVGPTSTNTERLAILGALSDIPSTNNNSKSGTFSLGSTSGSNYGWVATVANLGGVTFTSASAPGLPGGWDGAGLPGDNTGAGAPGSHITVTDGNGVLWRLWRQDYTGQSAETWTIS